MVYWEKNMFVWSGVALIDGCDHVTCIPDPIGLLRGILGDEHVSIFKSPALCQVIGSPE